MAKPSPLDIDVTRLRRHTGERWPLKTDAVFDDVALGDAEIIDGHIDIDLTLEAVTEGVVAAGVLHLRWRMPCRRCLDVVMVPVDVDFHEIFEVAPTEGETWPIVESRIDLTDPVREAALLTLPVAPLCGPDCVGPDPDRYPANSGPEVGEEPDEEPRDPRWAALDQLRDP